MRRSRRVDWLLLATLLPLYAVMQVAGIQAHLASGARSLPFALTGAQGAHGHPIVISLSTPQVEIEPGDRVLRLGQVDLRGLSLTEIGYRSVPLRREGRPFEVELERDGARFTAIVEPVPNPSWWWTIPVFAISALTATFLLLRAPHWHLARRNFVMWLLWCWWAASLPPLHPILKVPGSS